MITQFSKFWDNVVKPFATKVLKECKTDPIGTHYIGQMMFYVEHDLADGRPCKFRLYPCVGTLNADSYYQNVHKDTPKEEVKMLQKLGKMLKELMSKSGEK